MIGSSDNETTKGLLESILVELREIKALLVARAAPAPTTPDTPPYFPPAAPRPTVCPKCNLQLEGVMGMVCADLNCPTGLGPLSCGI